MTTETIGPTIPAYDPELCVLVGVRHKETKKEGIIFLYNEEEVDRRLEFIEKGLAEDNGYQEVFEQLVEFHRVRREAFEKIKDEIEIIPFQWR